MNENRSVAYFVQANKGSDGVQEKEINIKQHSIGNKNREKEQMTGEGEVKNRKYLFHYL